MNASKKTKIHVIVGSTRQNRFSEKPAQWIYDIAKQRKDLEPEIVDLRDYKLPFFDEPISPAYSKGTFNNEHVEKWAKKVSEADGYIIVAPEYNHGYSAILKNAFDHVYYEWNNKAVGFVSYGSVGGARSIEQMRLVAIELQMAPIRTSIHIPFSTYLAVIKPQELDAEGKPVNALDTLSDQANMFLDQLSWWTHALKAAREKNHQK